MNKFYVYCYIDPRNDEPFYIGKGCGNRDKVHSYPSRQRDTLFYRKKGKLEREGITPIVKRLIENITEKEANYQEFWFIRLLGRRSPDKLGPLCNLTDGGEGTSGCNNRSRSPKGKRRFIGITKRPNGAFEAQCKVGSHTIRLGRFLTREEAARVRDKAVIKHHGEGWLNFRPNDTDGYTGYWDEKNPDYDLWDCTLKVPNGHTPPAIAKRFRPPNGKRRFIGITKRPNGTFMAQCQIGSRQKYLGIFKTPEEAARAYDQAVIKEGIGGWLNFRPDDTDGYTGYWDKKNPDYDPTRA